MLRHAWFIAVLISAPLAAQKSGPQGDTWDSIAKLPDFGGLWEVTFGGGPRGAGEPPQFTPEYAAKVQAFQAASQRGEIEDGPAANCVPNGMPSIMTQPYPIEILFTPGKVTILIEAYAQWRQIFTDGRAHPEDPDLTFNGHSIGHWEGDTLVVDTVGFTTDTFLGNQGMRHSEKMHIVERFRLAQPDRLEVQTTIDDPQALMKPFTRTAAYGRHRDWTLAEYVCQQNNRNFTTDDGKAGIDLSFEEKQ
ncbi:MAG TPA: hypothetical protein VN818_00990 [Gammaproteobacteria bacterium]|nr:hypothetical protein [Gammaproteobacteria bacterium]